LYFGQFADKEVAKVASKAARESLCTIGTFDAAKAAARKAVLALSDTKPPAIPMLSDSEMPAVPKPLKPKVSLDTATEPVAASKQSTLSSFFKKVV
jgi:hypothetical protein